MPTSDSRRPLGAELEIGVSDGFRLAAVGDCIISRPISQLAGGDKGFAGVIDLLGNADVVCGNLETPILRSDLDGAFPCSDAGDWTLRAESSVAGDLAAMGIRLVARANNHALDWAPAGMRETGRLLEASGISHAGTGEHRGAARAASYLETGGGRVAMLSVTTTFRQTTDALPPRGAAPGRPGVSALRLQRRWVVPDETFERVTALAPLLPDPDGYGEPAPQDGVALLGERFIAGDVAEPYRSYHMNGLDLDELAYAVRQAKQHSDLLLVFVHSHEGSRGAGTTEEPGEFLVELAHSLIDAGVDGVFTTGIHRLGPIEVYRNRPACYGLGNFICSDIQEPLGADLHEANRALMRHALGHGQPATDGDLTNVLNAGWFADPEWFTSMVALCTFGPTGLRQFDVIPIDLGYGRTLTRSGIPRLADPDAVAMVIETLAEASRPFGTTIEVVSDPSGCGRGRVLSGG